MNNKLLYKIFIITGLVLIISILILFILGNISRIGYLSDFQLDESKSSERNYYYSFRIKYYSKIFRNSDIYGVYIDTSKTVKDNNFIKEIKFNEKGSPFGNLTSIKELQYDEKVDNVNYKLSVKLYVLILFIILFIFIYLSVWLFFILKDENKRKLLIKDLNKMKSFCIIYKKPIFIIYSIVVICFILFVIINSSIKHTSKLTDLELIGESKLGYVYKAKIDNFKERKLFVTDSSSIKFINSSNDVKYYGYSLEITNKPINSWYSTNIYYTDHNTFIISNESINQNAYYYNIQIPTYIGDKYKITILAKQLPETGNIFWHLNGYNNFKEITKKEVSNDYLILTDIREAYSEAGGALELHFIMPQGVTEIESIKIESLNNKFNINNGYIIFTFKDKVFNDDISISYNINTKYQIANIVVLLIITVFFGFSNIFSLIINTKIINIIFILLYAFISFPAVFTGNTYIYGLDPSWSYYINALADSYLKFGKDVIFTYGNLGYIIATLDIGNNLIISFTFRFFVYIINLLALYLLIKDRDIKIYNLFIVLIMLLIYSTSFVLYGLFDYYVSFTIVLLLLVDVEYKNIIYCLLAYLLIILLFFMKLSSGILNFGILFTYLFSIFTYKDKKTFINRTLLSLIIPILIILLYMIYNPNISDFFKYIKGAMEISSGYIYSMSFPYTIFFTNTLPIIFCYIFAIIYFVLIIYYYVKKDYSFVYLFIFSILFFLTYKHAFVRHALLFIYPFSFIIAIFILVNKNKKINYVLILSFIILSFMYKVNYITPFYSVYNNKINDIKDTFSKVFSPQKIQYTGEKLPKDMLNEINTNTVSIYPWEISYIISNKLNFIPMPIFQAYSAYTPYLDKLNADFFDNEKAPEYIIFEWESIDNRLPLTDTPLTFQKIYNNYYVHDVYNTRYILFKKRESTLNHTIKSNYTQNIDIYKDTIYFDNVTNDNTYMILKADLDLNVLGKLSKIVYQIPQVYANIETYSGKKHSFRILLPQLKNGIIISKLPTSLYELNTFFSNSLEDSVKSLSFSAEGLHLYKNNIDINVDIVEIK